MVPLHPSAVGQLLRLKRQAVCLHVAIVCRRRRTQYRDALRQQRAALLVIQAICGRQRQGSETKNLPTIGQIVGLQRDVARLPLPVIVNLIRRQRAGPLTQPFALIACRSRNCQRQCIHAQHFALIIQRLRVHLQRPRFQRTLLVDMVRHHAQRGAAADKPAVIQFITHIQLQIVRAQHLTVVEHVRRGDACSLAGKVTGVGQGAVQRQLQVACAVQLTVVGHIAGGNGQRLAVQRALIIQMIAEIQRQPLHARQGALIEYISGLEHQRIAADVMRIIQRPIQM